MSNRPEYFPPKSLIQLIDELLWPIVRGEIRVDAFRVTTQALDIFHYRSLPISCGPG